VRSLVVVAITITVASCNSQGAEGQSCYPNGTCNAGLTCASDLCVNVGADGGDASTSDAGTGDAGTKDGGDASATEAGSCGCVTPDAGLFTDSGTGCCGGGACVVKHFDGYYPFYDCVPDGGWSEQLALDACGVYFGFPCSAASCNDGGTLVVEATSQACIAWAYGGTDTTAIGHAREGAISGPCQCPTSSDTSWY
jgi:hypothetical protein